MKKIYEKLCIFYTKVVYDVSSALFKIKIEPIDAVRAF
jgi:hypothetical protein